MTMNELKGIYFIDCEIKRNTEALQSLKRYNSTDDIKGAYSALIQAQTDELIKQKERAEAYLNNIDDAQVRVIAKMRFIDLKTWSEIGDALNYDRTAVYNIAKKYFKKI